MIVVAPTPCLSCPVQTSPKPSMLSDQQMVWRQASWQHCSWLPESIARDASAARMKAAQRSACGRYPLRTQSLSVQLYTHAANALLATQAACMSLQMKVSKTMPSHSWFAPNGNFLAPRRRARWRFPSLQPLYKHHDLMHHDISQYYQTTSKMYATVLQNKLDVHQPEFYSRVSRATTRVCRMQRHVENLISHWGISSSFCNTRESDSVTLQNPVQVAERRWGQADGGLGAAAAGGPGLEGRGCAPAGCWGSLFCSCHW